ncbi:Serine/threonine-protein kinase env7 [Sorochytrium milnesiophthora]
MSSLATLFEHIIFALRSTFDSSYDHCIPLQQHKLLVKRTLGEGGFAVVFLVKDLHTGRLFALKRTRIVDSEGEADYAREIDASRRVSSPYVVQFVTTDTIALPAKGCKFGFMLMPLYKNGSLHDRIEIAKARRTPLSADLVVRYFCQICRALLAFHSCDPPLAFRDLKPMNILLTDAGASTASDQPVSNIVLIDLGSVRPARVKITNRNEAVALQDLAAISVTAPFRPPELFSAPSNADIDERTDVWSLGCVLYNMVYGECPFEGTESSALSTPQYPESAVSGMQQVHQLKSLVQFCLHTDIRHRPTVTQVLDRARELGFNCDI